jgi:hypothetical protein
MNTVTNKKPRVLCSLRFSNKRSDQVILAEISEPVSHITHPLGAPEPVRDWGSTVTVDLDGALHRKIVWSSNWPGAFMLALDYIRRFIPDGHEREWLDEDGVESWCVLPKLVPISWGHDLYARISQLSDQAEKEFVSEVERRRLAWENLREQEGK